MTNPATNLEKLEQETYRDSIQDGLLFVFGGLLLLITSNMYNNTLPLAIIIVFILFVFPQVIKIIRKKYVYPRIGYVKVKNTQPFEFIAFFTFMTSVLIMAGILVLLLPNGYSDTDNLYRVAPFLIGMVFFGPGLEMSDRTGQDRYLLMGLLPTISGLLITALSVQGEPWEAFRGLEIFTLLWGSVSLLFGGFQFFYFINKHPREEIEDE